MNTEGRRTPSPEKVLLGRGKSLGFGMAEIGRAPS